MGETILELQNIAKHFGDTDVLNGISISIGKGEFITLLGPSGCGKIHDAAHHCRAGNARRGPRHSERAGRDGLRTPTNAT